MKMIKKILLFDEKISFQMLKFYKHHIFNEIMKFISSCGDFGMSLVGYNITHKYLYTNTYHVYTYAYSFDCFYITWANYN